MWKLLIFFLGISLFSCNLTGADQEILVMSLNLRFDNPADGKNAWPERKALVKDYLLAVNPDILGVQESLLHQNEDLLRMLPGYMYIGTGRDDGKQGGEFSPVFFRIDRFELIGHGQFWLSETPDVPGSIGWEAVLPRVVAWARLKVRQTGQELFVFNTHFSHVSDLARRKSMEFMSAQIRKIAGDSRVLVTGDFNITKGSGLYNDMLLQFKQHNGLENAELVAEEPLADVMSTFNAFSDDASPRVIDYIFVDQTLPVKSYKVDKVTRGGIFISDHWPVLARVILPAG